MVSTGDINREIELDSFSKDIDLPYVEYDPETFAALMIRFVDDGPTVLIFRSGKYTITGATSHDQLYETNQRLVELLSGYGIIKNGSEPTSEVVNIVFTADLDFDIDLVKLLAIVGFENGEYEPEQSPFMVYRPENYDCVITVATSGKVVINGANNVETAKSAFENLKSKIEGATSTNASN